jgi:hypothetical protein
MHENMIGGTVLTNWLAILGLISLLYWAWRIVTAFHQRGSGDRKAAVPPAAGVHVLVPAQPEQSAPPNEDIAVIAAAVHAMLGTHRIVLLEPVRSGKAWEIEGRWAQQTSHTLR